MIAIDYITADEIRQRAYQLWLSEGCPEGCAERHWVTAERELQEARDAQHEEADKPLAAF